MEAHEIDSKLVELGLSVKSEFVPWSKSRNSKEKNPTLNWKVTLIYNGKEILTTDYSASMVYCPSYSQFNYKTVDGNRIIKEECEKGFAQGEIESVGYLDSKQKSPILPDSKNIIYSLLLDSDVINYTSFESWASESGYDEDSRAAEKIYNACMKIALQFRRIGEDNIKVLKELFQDY